MRKHPQFILNEEKNYSLNNLYLTVKRFSSFFIFNINYILNVNILKTKSSNAYFRIRDRKIINKIIFPIFDKYSLLTSKYFEYIRFKKAYNILNDSNIGYEEKNKLLFALKFEKKPEEYTSPA